MPQVVWPRVWEPCRLRRTPERAPAPRLVGRLRPRLTIRGWKDELIVIRATRGHPPGVEVHSERRQQPHSPMLARLRVSFLAERARTLIRMVRSRTSSQRSPSASPGRRPAYASTDSSVASRPPRAAASFRSRPAKAPGSPLAAAASPSSPAERDSGKPGWTRTRAPGPTRGDPTPVGPRLDPRRPRVAPPTDPEPAAATHAAGGHARMTRRRWCLLRADASVSRRRRAARWARSYCASGTPLYPSGSTVTLLRPDALLR